MQPLIAVKPPDIAPHLSAAELWSLVKAAVSAWIDDYAMSMGAALSYYTVFSLAPLLLIVISVAGLVFGAEAARGEVFAQIHGLVGADGARAIEDLLFRVSQPRTGIAGTLIGAVVLLIGATSVLADLQESLDRIWRAPTRPTGSGLWRLLRSRLLSFGLILGFAFLLMVSLLMGVLVAALGKWTSGFFSQSEVLLQGLNVVVGFGLTTVVFAMIYKLMPRVRVSWQDVWLGALVTAALFTIGRALIGVPNTRAGGLG